MECCHQPTINDFVKSMTMLTLFQDRLVSQNETILPDTEIESIEHKLASQFIPLDEKVCMFLSK